MLYTRLGRTGLKGSRLCLGTMKFGSHTSGQDAFAIMERALEVGTNFFDSANVRALDLQLDGAALATLDEIFPGPGAPAPEAYAW